MCDCVWAHGLSFQVKGTRCSGLIIVLRFYDYLKSYLNYFHALFSLYHVYVQEWEHDDQTLYFTNLPSQITAEVSLSFFLSLSLSLSHSLARSRSLSLPTPSPAVPPTYTNTLTNNLNINLLPPFLFSLSSFSHLSLFLLPGVYVLLLSPLCFGKTRWIAFDNIFLCSCS